MDPEAEKQTEIFYALNRIKKAFWDTFYEKGEIYFPYPEVCPNEERRNRAVQEEWERFLIHLG